MSREMQKLRPVTPFLFTFLNARCSSRTLLRYNSLMRKYCTTAVMRDAKEKKKANKDNKKKKSTTPAQNEKKDHTHLD